MRRFMLGGLALAALAIAIPARADLTAVSASPDNGGSGTTLYTGVGGPGSAVGTTIMDALYGAGNYTRVDDFPGGGPNGLLPNDQIWGYLGVPPTATITAEVKYAGNNSSFGVFQDPTLTGAANFTRLADITGGPAATFSNINATYATVVNATTFTIVGSGVTPPAIYAPFALGFLNSSQTQYYSSVQSLNTNDPGYQDHIVTFKITGGANAGAFVFAYEDLRKSEGSDRDFNDAVIQINGLTPVPEPSTLAIAGIGAMGFGAHAWRRRVRKGKKS